uniref:C-type lectin domain-containing protein n=1 Tax=Monopterus albus TaxID=43700 RepID=A0A3Q3J7N7_MONAL
WQILIYVLMISLYFSCEQGWEKHKGQCYHFSNKTLPWNESRHRCKKMGGDLVETLSWNESRHQCKKMGGDLVKIDKATWLWVDNSTLSTSLIFWHGLEPNNAGNPDGEDCVTLRVNEAEDLKTWFDQSCKADHKRISFSPINSLCFHFVCNFKATPLIQPVRC